MLALSEDHIDANHVKILTNRQTKLEKLHNDRLQAEQIVGSQQWNCALWSQLKYRKKKFKFGDYVLWFQKTKNTSWEIYQKMVWSIHSIILFTK